jgi:NitT/TauT family transport system permease protein/taurine transport system permease protein
MDTNLINRPRHAAVPTGFRYVISLSGFLFLGALWQLAVHIRGSPALPPLGAVLRTAFSLILDRSFFRHILTSMEIIVFGIFLATAVGFCAGVLLFRYRKLKESVLPVIECVRGIAALTLFPLLIITFGIGTVSRVFVIFWTAWPAIVLSTMNSLSVDPHIVDAARTGGAAEWKIITHIRIPMAMHGLITGLRIGVGGGWVSLITA